jgi:hypothetical protein
LAIVDGAVRGENLQPSDRDLAKLMKASTGAKDWTAVFPGVAQLNLVAEGSGPGLSLRLTKKEGVPVQLVPEGTPGATVVAIRRVDELGYYSLGRDQIAAKVGLTGPKTTAVILAARIKEDPDCFKQITIGRSKFDRYSPRAIERVQETLAERPIDEIWRSRRNMAKV